VILEVSTGACRANDLHFGRCAIAGGDFNGATNA
jgi:hypothetical protein